MFVRAKKSGRHTYLQIVQNQRENGKVRQQVIATLGRLDILQQEGKIDGLLQSCSKFTENLSLLDSLQRGEIPNAKALRIGPALVFERIWKELGLQDIIKSLLKGRRFSFAVERVIFMTVLHRLMNPGSDRSATSWMSMCDFEGVDSIELHHCYRAMAWLGEVLDGEEQIGSTPFAPRCVKDQIEEELFQRTRDMFTELELVFFDTTSIYFEGKGGESIGQYGYSKDHRPDRKQVVVGAVIDSSGRPICCELWPGNTADVKSLLPIVDRIQKRFHVSRVCIVADRGMISKEVLAALESGTYKDVSYILGVRMRNVKAVRKVVLEDPGTWTTIHPARKNKSDPMPLKVKSVMIEGKRHILCLNDEQRKKDVADRDAILSALRDKLKQGGVSLVGNKGYRRYLKERESGNFIINEDRLTEEEAFDGKWVLRTDLNLDAGEVALKYKELWQVEAVFRMAKGVLETRPIYHHCDATIRGHVFCSFLALVLLKELMRRMEERGWSVEWGRLKNDLDSLQRVTAEVSGKTITMRTQVTGDAGRALQAVGVGLGSTITSVD